MFGESWKLDDETDIPTCADVVKYVNQECHLLLEFKYRGMPFEGMLLDCRKNGELVKVDTLASRFHRDAQWVHREDLRVLDVLPGRGIPEPPERGTLCPRPRRLNE